MAGAVRVHNARRCTLPRRWTLHRGEDRCLALVRFLLDAAHDGLPGRDNFNNPLIVLIGFATLWLSISGVLLLLRSFRLHSHAHQNRTVSVATTVALQRLLKPHSRSSRFVST
jgi:hypothetical protein